ncbi:MAG: PKD domain-containing protein [Solirubrobacterales bacterium]
MTSDPPARISYGPGRRWPAVRLITAMVLAVGLLALSDGVAQARVVFAHGRAYGVTPTPRVRKTRSLLALRGRASALSVGGPQPPVVYRNGPLMLRSKLYLIFWQQTAGEFSSAYTGAITQYAKDLELEDLRTTDEFSVAEQYKNKEGEAITGKVELGGVVQSSDPYPPLEESEGCTKARAPCLTDTQIRKEIVEQIEANHWPTDSASAPEAQYLLYTPKGVTTCEFEECAPEEFCAYHSEITKLGPEKKVAVYSDLPYVPECDSGQAPTGVDGNKDTDGTLDSEIHEIVESATDPEPETGYTDENGEEVADKCTGPTVEAQPEVYGTPLGGSLLKGTAFNQLIDAHSYYTQQIWSQAPTKTPVPATKNEAAGCAARIGPTPSFTAPTAGETGHAISFDGSASYDISAPITAYEWNFGDGSAVDTSSGPTSTHYYLRPGEYQVSLTVIDSGGTAGASTQTLPIIVSGVGVGPPVATIEVPADHQADVAGETIPTKFSCTEAAGGPGIESCTDSNGSASPGTLNDSTPGSYTYTVTAVSYDGQRSKATIEYTVSTSNPSPGSSGGAAGSTPGTGSSGAGGQAKSPSRAQKLTRALKACKKLKKSKRPHCVAAAKKRFAPARK